MSEQEQTGAALIYSVLALLSLFFILPLGLMIIWNWQLAPYFHLPNLTYSISILLMVFCRLLVGMS